jgi:hypothetical protein
MQLFRYRSFFPIVPVGGSAYSFGGIGWARGRAERAEQGTKASKRKPARLFWGRLYELDTRTKVLTASEARQRLAEQPACWVSGHFDPLLAEHVQRLRGSKAPGMLLVVEVTNPLQPLLVQRARAELVAALAMVDYAVMSDRPPSGEPSADTVITERFIVHVLGRYRQEAGR